MKQIDYIDMACNKGRPVELRDGRKAYVVGNAENFFHQLNCKKSPLCKYIGFSTVDEFPGTVAIMTWDDSGKYQGKLMHDPLDIVGLWSENDEDTSDVAKVVAGDNDIEITEIHKDFGKYESGLGASIDKLVDETLALKNTMLKHRIRHVEAETRCKVISVTEIINGRDDCYTYKFLLSNDAVKTVAIPKTTLVGLHGMCNYKG
jgi:hypothetical protein|nr:MAG TPA: hypothetical protein [Caudoviricetes sp.]